MVFSGLFVTVRAVRRTGTFFPSKEKIFVMYIINE